MGASFTNCHVRTSNFDLCSKALSEVASARAFLTAPKKGWISVYDEASETQDLAEVERVAKGLSKRIQMDVIALLLHDSDVFIYQAYRKGKLVDQFNSQPDYFGPVTASKRKKWAGNPDKLRALAPPGVTAERIGRVLKKKVLFQEELTAAFARLMGISADRACTGFRYVAESPNAHKLVFGHGHSLRDSDLITGVEKGDIEKVRELLSQGVSPNLKSRLMEPLLTTAIRFHKKEIAQALMDAGADAFSPPEANAVWAAAAHGEREILARLLQSPSDKLKACLSAALLSAVQMGHVEIVRDLLQAGADPNGPDSGAFTPLMASSFRGLEVMWEVVAGRDFPAGSGGKKTDWAAMVRALVEAGADVNAQSSGMNALALARTTGQKEVVKILEDAGSDPNLKPSGPYFQELVTKFRTDAGKSAKLSPPAPGAVNAGGAPSKIHLDPRVRDMVLKLICKRQAEEEQD